VNAGLPTPAYVQALAAAPNGDLYAGTIFTVSGGVFRSTNNGSTWSNVTNDFGSTTLTALAVTPGGLVVAGSFDGLARSTNSGESWIPVAGLPGSSVNVHGITLTGSGDLLVSLSGSGVVLGSENGTNWTEVSSGLPRNVSPLAVDADGIAYAGSSGGGVYRTTSSTGGTTINLSTGWNMVSVPRITAVTDPDQLFPGRQGAMFAYNTLTGLYEIAAALTPGPGYWAQYSGPAQETINGALLTSASVPAAAAGFVLVGSVTAEVPVSNITTSGPGVLTGTVFRFDTALQSYVPTSVLHPGEGHWVQVTGPCTLSIASTAASPDAGGREVR
jgi:hypothetical protein